MKGQAAARAGEIDRHPRSLTALLLGGARFLAALARGRAPGLGIAPGVFVRALGSALRPHFFVFPAAAALAGAAAVPGARPGPRVVAAALSMGLAWGVGQLVNDLLDVDADRVDAPHRPGVAGLLPEGPTAGVALALGVAVAIAMAALHPLGICLVVASGTLLALYAPAKGVPVLGNLAHAALIAVVALVGAAAASPHAPLLDAVRASWPSALLAGGIAAVYLQANYEKDRVGDARAGQRTLAHVLGLRPSALGREAAALGLAFIAWRAGLLSTSLSQALMAVAVAGVTSSVALVLVTGTEAGALCGYRYAVHATSAALFALAAPLLGMTATLALLLFAAVLVERAFAISPNP